MARDSTSISLDKEVGEQFREIKKASDASTNGEFVKGLIGENEDIEVRLKDLDTVELEKTEEAKETRAMAVGVLEAMQRTGFKEDVIDLIEELRKREMVETNKQVVQYIMKKAQAGESLNEADNALLNMVVEIERSREESSAATAIAEGLFGEVEETKAETTTTERTTSSQTAEIETPAGESNDSLFDGVEDV